MTEIQNSKPIYYLEERQPNDFIIGYWDLGFICILVLGI